MTTRRILWVLPLFLIQVLGSGVFEVTVLSLNNNRGVTQNGRCCTGSRTTPPCTAECVTFLSVCLMHAVQVVPHDRTCTFGSAMTSVIGSNNIASESVDNGCLLKMPITFRWQWEFTLIIEAWHDLYGNLTMNDQSQLIIRSQISTSVSPGLTWHGDTAVTPTTELSYAYRLVCNVNYYGDGCTVFCRPRDNQLGHYRCSENGSRVCLPGWSGDFCENPLCSERCLQFQGVCDRPYECRCRMGWHGEDCDQCTTSPGCLHGYCYEPWQCICDVGWTGRLCDIDIEYCSKSEPCLNGGTCASGSWGNYTCKCPDGFAGVNCQYPLCQEGFCQNGGECQIQHRVRKCTCQEGYYGHRCQHRELNCEELTCLNGGTCFLGNNGATCGCRPGYTGRQCERDIDECQSNPCLNEGRCEDRLNGYTCRCPAGFTGVHCGIELDMCAGVYCRNGGTCVFKTGRTTPYCSCPSGFVGEYCQISTDPCYGITCYHGGTCSISPMQNGYICYCAKGYQGENCELKFDPCGVSPCINGGSCKSYTDSYLCLCPSGFTGKLCEREIMASDQVHNKTEQGETISDSKDRDVIVDVTSDACQTLPRTFKGTVSLLMSWLLQIIIVYRINQT